MSSQTIPTDRRPIGFWLKLVDRLIDEQFERTLGGQGLTRRHWQVLNVLPSQQGEALVAEIDEQVSPFLGGAEQTTQPIVNDLIARGWVAANDGHVALTPTGDQMRTILLDEVSKGRQALIAGIAPQDYALTVSVLERMARNLGWSPQE